ncbi:MAG: hypothetical protein R3F55_05035 [Alphaproteobacteria bacterium]
MGIVSGGWAAALAVCLAAAAAGCTKPPAPQPVVDNGEPGPPPATPVVPVQSQPLGAPGG